MTVEAGVAEPITVFPRGSSTTTMMAGSICSWAASRTSVDAVVGSLPWQETTRGLPPMYPTTGTARFGTVEAKLDRVMLAMGANFGDLDK